MNAIFNYEVNYRLRSTATWACLILLILMGYREMLGGEWDSLMQSGRVARNSPYAIYYIFMYYTFWAATVGSALVIPTLLRDLTSGSASFLYSFNLNSKSYFIGKYLACLSIVFMVMLSVVIAMLTLPYLSGLLSIYPDSDFITTPWSHLLHGIVLWILPMSIVYTAVPFSLTALTGKATPAYAMMMICIGLFVLITAFYGDGAPQAFWLQVVDPLGKVTIESQIFYWTAEQRMHSFLALEGAFLYNRLLYLSLALGLLIFAYLKFDLIHFQNKTKIKKAVNKAQGHHATTPYQHAIQEKMKIADISHLAYWLRLCFRLAAEKATTVVLNKAFCFSMLTLILMLVIAGLSYKLPALAGTATPLPSSELLLPALTYPCLIFTMLAAAFFVVDMCNKDHQVNTAQLVAACPIPTWVNSSCYIIAAAFIAFALTLIPVFSVLCVQVLQGYLDINWANLLHVTLLVIAPLMLAYSFIAVICYGLVQHKIIAQILAVLLCISPAILHETGTVENYLYLWAWPSVPQLSTIVSSEQFIARDAHFAVYWLSLYVALLIFVTWLWPRGVVSPWLIRIKSLGTKMTLTSFTLFVAFFCLFLWQGQFIYQQVVVNGEHRSVPAQFEQQLDYEQKYKAHQTTAQPHITHAELDITIIPAQRSAQVSGKLLLDNIKTRTLLINKPHASSMQDIQLDNLTANKVVADDLNEVVVASFNNLPQNRPAKLSYTLNTQYLGFHNESGHYLGKITANSSYLDKAFWPSIGFDYNRTIQDKVMRQRVKLPPATAFTQHSSHYAAHDARLTTYQLNIKVPDSHYAVAPGERQAIKQQDGQSLFSYTMNTPSTWNPAVVTGHFAMLQTKVNINTDVAPKIEVFYHSQHKEMAQFIAEATNIALNKAISIWGEFPYPTARIAPIPENSVAAKVSGNLILLPEQQIWQLDLSKANSRDWIKYVIGEAIAKSYFESVLITDNPGYPLITEGIPTWFAFTQMPISTLSQVDILSRITDQYLLLRTSESGEEKPIEELTDELYATSKAKLNVLSAQHLIGMPAFVKLIDHNYQLWKKGHIPVNNNWLLSALESQTNNLQTRKNSLSSTTHTYDFSINDLQLTELEQGNYQLTVTLNAQQITKNTSKKSQGYSGSTTTTLLFENGEKRTIAVNFYNGEAQLNTIVNAKPIAVLVNTDGQFIEVTYSDNQRSL
ncbi:hypothetical protein ORJ66_09990 [Pseudoalteromonas tunicata]|uniref:ABC transporter permease/M1 family aminopeptidase n=1 Tax=Pseudoalteromonas tunicata TaxID=314281 RepID=UPI00273E47E2|nr:hypothetical protein [Pseudoalteromonas tunicata]MDP5213370.1 hypothetical protein [Pseudoalteromonas tunicata]